MDRRTCIVALGGALAWPAAVLGQQDAMRRVAWISPGREDEGKDFLDALRLGLRERGYVEGRNLVLQAHWGNESGQRTAELAQQLVTSPPDVIVTQGATALALQRANATTPVVFGYSGDPVEAGLVTTIFKGARPGELAVELPTAFELVLNLRAAKALGISVPPSMQLRADRVIE